MTHPNQALLESFYAAFGRRDGASMAAAYRDDARFSDPVFVDLRGPEVGGMWRMLCARGKDLRIQLDEATADDASGRARWQAWYTFSGTGRPVHNIVEARFRFADGKISEHHDTFDLYRWSRMALPFVPGTLLGWTPLVKSSIRKKARGQLEKFLSLGR